MKIFYSSKCDMKMSTENGDGRHVYKIYFDYTEELPRLMEVVAIVLCKTGLVCVARVVYIGSELNNGHAQMFILCVQIAWKHEHEIKYLETLKEGL